MNDAKKGDDLAAINTAVENLRRASQAMAEHIYASTSAPSGAPTAGAAAGATSGRGSSNGGPKADDVIDVEFEEKK